MICQNEIQWRSWEFNPAFRGLVSFLATSPFFLTEQLTWHPCFPLYSIFVQAQELLNWLLKWYCCECKVNKPKKKAWWCNSLNWWKGFWHWSMNISQIRILLFLPNAKILRVKCIKKDNMSFAIWKDKKLMSSQTLPSPMWQQLHGSVDSRS